MVCLRKFSLSPKQLVSCTRQAPERAMFVWSTPSSSPVSQLYEVTVFLLDNAPTVIESPTNSTSLRRGGRRSVRARSSSVKPWKVAQGLGQIAQVSSSPVR
jgi:hypothetical protein